MVFDGEGKPPCHVQMTGSMMKMKCGCPTYKSTMMCSHSGKQLLSMNPVFHSSSPMKEIEKRCPIPTFLVGNNLPQSAGKKSGG